MMRNWATVASDRPASPAPGARMRLRQPPRSSTTRRRPPRPRVSRLKIVRDCLPDNPVNSLCSLWKNPLLSLLSGIGSSGSRGDEALGRTSWKFSLLHPIRPWSDSCYRGCVGRSAANASRLGRHGHAGGGPVRVLVVEDEEAPAEIFHDFLMALGHQPIVVHTAEAGLRELRSARPDPGLLDIRLPGMTCLAVRRPLHTPPTPP